MADTNGTQDLWLLNLFPFTGGGWDAGDSMRFAAEMALQEINADPSVLPGFRLRILWQNSQCDGEKARDLFLQNIIDEVYWRFEDLPHRDADGDGIISTEETLVGEQRWNATQVQPPPIGLFGAGCSSESRAVNNVAYRFRLPVVSPGSSFAGLSDRAAFPNFFRTIVPDSALIKAWFTMLRVFGGGKLFLVTGFVDVFRGNIVKAVAEAAAFGVELVGQDLRSEVAGWRGYHMSVGSELLASEAMGALKASKTRFAALLSYEEEGLHVLCAAGKQGLFATVWFSNSVFAKVFWDSPGVPCSPEEIVPAISGFTASNVLFWRSDADAALDCSRMTAGEFKAEFYRRQGRTDLQDGMADGNYYTYSEGACSADAVCMYARALHEVLVVQQMPLQQLVNRETSAYQALVDALSVTDFEGVTGRLRYVPGQVEPEGNVVIYQVQLPRSPCLGPRCGTSGVIMSRVASLDASGFSIVSPMKFHYDHEVYQPAAGLSSVTPPLEDFRACERGTVYDIFSGNCRGCLANQSYVQAVDSCLCSHGFYGIGTCTPCPPGSASSVYGATECDPCRPGFLADEPGLSECSRCGKGRFSSSPGATECEACAEGRLTDGTGYSSPEACGCGPGSFAVDDGSPCLDCGDGAVCAGFGAAPESAPGYALAAADARGLSIFRCRGVPERCPGGAVGTCAPGRMGVACSDCLPGHSPASGGRCEPCEGLASGGLFVLLVVLAFGLTLLYLKARSFDAAKVSHTQLKLLLAASQMLGALQTLSVVSMLAVSWPSLVFEPLRFLRIFSLDVTVLRLECIGALRDTVGQYAFKLSGLPLSALFVVGLHLAVALVRSEISDVRLWLKMGNALGTLLMALYITVCAGVLAPFHCVEHPSGDWTVVSYPGELCWTSARHRSMLAISSVAVLFPLSFFALAVWVVRSVHARTLAGDVLFLSTFAFLLFRFKPGMQLFSLWYVGRNLAVALVPALPDTLAQIVVLVLLMGATALLTCWSRPWAMGAHNALEVLSCVGITFVVGFGVVFIEDSTRDGVSGLVFASLILVLFAIFASTLAFAASFLAKTVFRERCGHHDRYGYFLCHHKGSAGTLARLLKMTLAEVTSKRVFLDSDNLKDLRFLFNVVRERTERLVVLCSAELLRRPWCMGEIATAKLSKVSLQPVALADFAWPDASQLGAVVAALDVALLAESGLTLLHVEVGLEALQAVAPRPLGADITADSTRDLCVSLAGKGGSASDVSSAPWSMSSSMSTVRALMTETAKAGRDQLQAAAAPSATLVADESNPEALAAALVLRKLMAMRGELVMLFHEGERAFACGLFLCSGSCWASESFLAALHRGAALCSPAWPVIVDEGFQFPNNDFYSRLQDAVIQEEPEMSGARAGDAGSVLHFAQALFKKIAPVVPMRGSAEALAQGAEAVRKLTRRMLKDSSRGKKASSPGKANSEGGATSTLSRSPKQEEGSGNSTAAVGAGRAGGLEGSDHLRVFPVEEAERVHV